MKNFKQIIKNKLKDTTKCGFKKVWIPKGWACVKIDVFSTELAKIIKKEIKK